MIPFTYIGCFCNKIPIEIKNAIPAAENTVQHLAPTNKVKLGNEIRKLPTCYS